MKAHFVASMRKGVFQSNMLFSCSEALANCCSDSVFKKDGFSLN